MNYSRRNVAGALHQSAIEEADGKKKEKKYHAASCVSLGPPGACDTAVADFRKLKPVQYSRTKLVYLPALFLVAA